MATATFDTLKYANTLKDAGLPDKQAEAQASLLGERLCKELQSDLRETEQRVSARIDALDAKINVLAAKLDSQIALVKSMIGLALLVSFAALFLLIVLLPWFGGVPL